MNYLFKTYMFWVGWAFVPDITEKYLRAWHDVEACPWSGHEVRAYSTFAGWRIGCEFCGCRGGAFPEVAQAVKQWNKLKSRKQTERMINNTNELDPKAKELVDALSARVQELKDRLDVAKLAVNAMLAHSRQVKAAITKARDNCTAQAGVGSTPYEVRDRLRDDARTWDYELRAFEAIEKMAKGVL